MGDAVTSDEAAAIRLAYAGHPDEEFVLGLVEQVMMWQKAAAHDGLDDLRNLSRVARGERRKDAGLDVEVPCECHCCQKMAKAEERREDRERAEKRRRIAIILHGRRR